MFSPISIASKGNLIRSPLALYADGYLSFDTASSIVFIPNGNRRQEYQPTYYELKNQRDIERKFEEAKLDLKATDIKIEQLEFKRLRDLADQAMQLELLRLLSQKNELMQLIERLQQQRLRALQDDEDVIFLMAYLI